MTLKKKKSHHTREMHVMMLVYLKGLFPHSNVSKFHLLSYLSENSQIPCFGKVCGKLALFRKYLAIYHFFSTQVSKNQVLNSI